MLLLLNLVSPQVNSLGETVRVRSATVNFVKHTLSEDFVVLMLNSSQIG